MVITEISRRTTADNIRYDFASFSENDRLHISLRAGFIADMGITRIIAVIELLGVICDENLTQPSCGG